MDPNPFGDSGIYLRRYEYKGGFDVLETIGAHLGAAPLERAAPVPVPREAMYAPDKVSTHFGRLVTVLEIGVTPLRFARARRSRPRCSGKRRHPLATRGTEEEACDVATLCVTPDDPSSLRRLSNFLFL